MQELKFDQKKVLEAEQDYKNVHITPIQRAFVEIIAKTFSEYLHLPEMALKGFINFSIRDFQVNNKRDLAQYQEWSTEDKKNTNLQMNEIFEGYLSRILVDDSQKPQLREIMKQVNEKALNEFV